MDLYTYVRFFLFFFQKAKSKIRFDTEFRKMSRACLLLSDRHGGCLGFKRLLNPGSLSRLKEKKEKRKKSSCKGLEPFKKTTMSK